MNGIEELEKSNIEIHTSRLKGDFSNLKQVEKEISYIEDNLKIAMNEYVRAVEDFKKNLKYWIEWIWNQEADCQAKTLPFAFLTHGPHISFKTEEFDRHLDVMCDYATFKNNREHFLSLLHNLHEYMHKYYWTEELPRSILGYLEALNNFKAISLNVDKVLERLREMKKNHEALYKDYTSKRESLELELDLLNDSARLAWLSLEINSRPPNLD